MPKCLVCHGSAPGWWPVWDSQSSLMVPGPALGKHNCHCLPVLWRPLFLHFPLNTASMGLLRLLAWRGHEAEDLLLLSIPHTTATTHHAQQQGASTPHCQPPEKGGARLGAGAVGQCVDTAHRLSFLAGHGWKRSLKISKTSLGCANSVLEQFMCTFFWKFNQ